MAVESISTDSMSSLFNVSAGPAAGRGRSTDANQSPTGACWGVLLHCDMTTYVLLSHCHHRHHHHHAAAAAIAASQLDTQ